VVGSPGLGRPRLEAVGANLEHVSFVNIQTDEGLEDGITIPDDIDVLNELVAEVGANLLIVDPLVAHLPGGIDSHKDQSVRRALAPLYRLAEAQGCAVVALMHLNKAQRAGTTRAARRFVCVRQLRAKRPAARP
jgi:RecA-family ATPase